VKLGEATEDVVFADTTDEGVAGAAGLKAPGFAAIKNFKGGCSGACRHAVRTPRVGAWVLAAMS